MIPLSEYPRPQLVRESYICLNGKWEYAIRDEESFPDRFDGDILVPFSPETKESGVGKVLSPSQFLFYRRKLEFPEGFIKDKVILHFGAVDQIAEVYVNDQFVGKHIGGFLPFSYDIKPFLKDGENTLSLRVTDTTNSSYHSSGKQALKPEGIWYPPQSGIYMPVWMESVNDEYVESIKITPNIEESKVVLNVRSAAEKCTIVFNDEETIIPTNIDYSLTVEDPQLWSPESPFLYTFYVKTAKDSVKSYFAMRSVSLMKDEKGMTVIALNGKPYFMKGVLDQGYYESTLLTPYSDEEYIRDIKRIKALGFNVSRKHIKIESLRWYYHCDCLGLLVWQDFVNGCTKYDFWLNQVPLFVHYKLSDKHHKLFFRESEEGRKEAVQEFKDTINLLYNCPCIVYWTIFNEGWGQFDSKKIYKELKQIDHTRIYDHASGWHDQNTGDVFSRHIYMWKLKMPLFRKLRKRAYVVSECGAYIMDKNETKKKKAGLIYKVFNNENDFASEYKRFIEKEVIPCKKKGMSAFIYTQFSDVEDEKNGFVSYNRKEDKISPLLIKNINDNI